MKDNNKHSNIASTVLKSAVVVAATAGAAVLLSDKKKRDQLKDTVRKVADESKKVLTDTLQKEKAQAA